MRTLILCSVVGASIFSAGCGGGKTEIDGRQLTDEEKAQMKAEDDRVEGEESQGKIVGGKKAK